MAMVLLKLRSRSNPLLLLLEQARPQSNSHAIPSAAATRWYSSNNDKKSKTTPRSALYSRILPLGNPRISLVPELDRWAEKGRVIAADLQFMIRELRKRRRHKQALEVSEWMHNKGIAFMPRDHAVHLDLIGSVRGLTSAETYFNCMKEEGKTEKAYGALLNCYVRERLTEKSLAHMQKMRELGFAINSLTYNNIMCLYTKTGQHEKVHSVLADMKENGVLPDNFSYRICINSYGALSNIERLERVLEEMENQPHIFVDWNTYAVVAYIYIKQGLRDQAVDALRKSEENMDTGDTLCYNYLISLYAHLKNKPEIQRLWALQKSKFKKQSNKDYMTVLWAMMKAGEVEAAEALLKEWKSSKKTLDFRVPNVLLAEYCSIGLVEKAEAILESFIKEGKEPPASSWGIVSKGFTRKGEFKKAYQCMKKALGVYVPNSGWEPNPKVVASIFQGLGDKHEDEIKIPETVLIC